MKKNTLNDLRLILSGPVTKQQTPAGAACRMLRREDKHMSPWPCVFPDLIPVAMTLLCCNIDCRVGGEKRDLRSAKLHSTVKNNQRLA